MIGSYTLSLKYIGAPMMKDLFLIFNLTTDYCIAFYD